MKITENTRVVEALKLSHNVHSVFDKYGLYCAGCKGAVEDTIGKVADNNGLDLKKLLAELNKAQ